MSESKALVVADKQHSELGASIAKRWMACPGSVRLTRGMPNPSSIHAEEGTAAHALAELCLTSGREPADYVGEALDAKDAKVVVTESMADAVKVYVDHCRTFMAGTDAGQIDHVVEQRISLESLNPPAPMFGTADFMWWHIESGSMGVVDLKYGKGVVVEAEDNPQLRYYALGALLSMHPAIAREMNTVSVSIVQPRAQHAAGPIRTEEFSVDALLEFAGELLAAARRTQEPDAPLVAGDHCRFCPASAVCPALHAKAQAIAQVEFSAIETHGHVPPAPSEVPLEILAEWLPNLGILEQWITDVRAHVRRALLEGREVPGYKLVEGRQGNREWADAESAQRHLEQLGYLEEDLVVKALKSPAQIEKLTGKKHFPKELTVRKAGHLNVARDTDPRPAASLSAAQDFDALPPGDEA